MPRNSRGNFARGRPCWCAAGGAPIPISGAHFTPSRWMTKPGRCACRPAVTGRTPGCALLPEGAEVDCIGPVGNGYHLRPQARNVLCIGEGDAAWALLPALLDAAAAGLAVTFAMEADLERDLIAATRLPAAVEYHTATPDAAGRGRLPLADMLAWADMLVICRVARFLRAAGDGDRNRAVRRGRRLRAGALPGDVSLRLRRMPGVRRRRRGRAAARLPARPGVRPEGCDPCPLNLRPATSVG